MRIFPASYLQALQDVPEQGGGVAHFFYIEPRDRQTGDVVPYAFWTGQEDVPVTVTRPDGVEVTRTYLGNRGLIVGSISYVGTLTSQSVSVSLSQSEPEPQEIVRQHDAQRAYCEIYTAVMNKGAFPGPPQLEWVGVLDKAPIKTPAIGGRGQIALTIRSEMMWQLGRSNPAKSSHEHQRRRRSDDDFCKYATLAESRKVLLS
ncbi:hypothetical protein [Pseudooceanicola sp. MF1-13]|uniref:hypothetical protein n=1 Tax=Pseudooceanicola sp. MF1-13 TaxID=3379095 RepID=UPI0038914A01